jgi:hypothetical protein
MQKLVTIYLHPGDQYPSMGHAKVEEHLGTYLGSGWRIVSVTSLTSGGDSGGGFVVVVLEKV